MKLHELFKKKNKSTTELDQRLDIVLELNKKLAELYAKTAGMDEGLVGSYVTDGDSSDACAKLANQRAEIDALKRIIGKAAFEAIENLRSESQGARERIEKLQEKIKEIQRKISLAKIQEILKFIHTQGFKIKWPSEYYSGEIMVPLLPGVEIEEIPEIEARARQDTRSVNNPFDAELEQLRKNLQHEEMLCFTPLQESLDILLAQRKRTIKGA